ncbi:MAG: iron ABC transporter permease [Candidatus Aminicenantes bacterium]|nr:iron ABC transporter permease [Candidatus Aminicenantes bacterium]
MKAKVILLYGLVFLAVAIITPWIGPEPLDARDVLAFSQGTLSTDAHIFWFQRVPRVLLALLAGGTLAVVGAAFQVLFRNPLVEPYTIGMSGGSALGAFLAISVPSLWINWGPFSSIQFFALLGAGACLALIYSLARRPQAMSVYTLLLAGVTISIICGGLILFLSYLASPHVLVLYHRWMMGGIDVVGFRDLYSLAPLLIPGLLLLFYHARDLNHIALGEEMALGHGVDTKKAQSDIFIGGGLATAAVVSFVGPIGFVGLIVPHAVRRLSGFDQRTVLPCSFLLGGSALTLCDSIARSILSPAELPVGIITAIIGGPLFIRLLISRRWR